MALVAAGAMLAGALTVIDPAIGAVGAAEASDPTPWPTDAGTDPGVSATAHTVRFSGADRYQTNLATALALRGRGGFPFDSPDATGGGATTLAAADHWWGARTCPYSVLIVAGDTPADALAAASLSDPTNRSSEPRVPRVASADPAFDPVGGFDRVDTDGAPIIVTRSAREGATALDQAARLAVTDLAAGGCTTAREALIVGGEAAVPTGVADELLAIGFTEVFRLAGPDRYTTAAKVAEALGTGPPAPAGAVCASARADGPRSTMGFYGNATAEFRFTPSTCRLLARSVVLAEGVTGADALAAGWWTSFWQVPVLLVAPDGSLPVATRYSLSTQDIDNLIVLGGTGRIPEATVVEAGRLASAAVGRIAGRDRYETSVHMAKVFGGWYPSPGAGEASMVCLAASAGEGEASIGWPDALAAGPWCGRVSGSAANPGAPTRALPPIEAPHAVAHDVGGHRPARDAVPILLVRPGAGALPGSVSALLGELFPSTALWCSASVAPAGCTEPGFGIVFGGAGVVSDAAVLDAARLVSGGVYTAASDINPTLDDGFATQLNMTPLHRILGDGQHRVCYLRDAIGDVRWLATWDDASRRSLLAAIDIASPSRYVGAGRSSEPLCVGVPVDDDGTQLSGVSLSGRVLAGERVFLDGWLGLSRPIRTAGGSVTVADDTTTWRWEGAEPPSVRVELDASSHPIEVMDLELAVHHPVGAVATFVGTVVVRTAAGDVRGAAAGEAVSDGGRWLLRGRVAGSMTLGSTRTFVGGFTADVTPNQDSGDTEVLLALDGLLAR